MLVPSLMAGEVGSSNVTLVSDELSDKSGVGVFGVRYAPVQFWPYSPIYHVSQPREQREIKGRGFDGEKSGTYERDVSSERVVFNNKVPSCGHGLVECIRLYSPLTIRILG